MTETFVALALGSNVGDRVAALQAAVDKIRPYVALSALSPVYEAAPVYVPDQPAFLNAVVTGTTRIAPLALLWTLKDLESEIGRLPVFRYGPRVIDIDILFYGDEVVQTPELYLPHPRMAERAFVLRPLADIAPEWRHPQNGQTVAAMLAELPETPLACLGNILTGA